MRKVVALSLTLALGLTALAAVPAAAAKKLDPCDQAAPIVGGTFASVTVPEGGTCVLDNVIVEGDVRADKAADAQIILSTVKGDVLISDTAVAQVGWSIVHGDVRFERNGTKGTLGWAIRGSNVRGDCEARDNVGSREVHSNLVKGNAMGQCKPRALDFASR